MKCWGCYQDYLGDWWVMYCDNCKKILEDAARGDREYLEFLWRDSEGV